MRFFDRNIYSQNIFHIIYTFLELSTFEVDQKRCPKTGTGIVQSPV